MYLRNFILFNLLFLISISFCETEKTFKEKQKLIFDNHRNQVADIKKDYLIKKTEQKKQYNRLLPLYNTLQKEYEMIIDSLDNIVKKQINNFDKNDDPQMLQYINMIKKAKEKQSKQIQNREDYYKNEFAKIDSNINFLFDMILIYEKNSFDQNNTILDLDAQIIALKNINDNAKNTILSYENGISNNKLNKSIVSLNNADRLIYEKNYTEAIKECKIAIQNFPNFPVAYEKLGSAYYLNDNMSEALKNWTIALSMDPDNTNLNKFLEEIKNIN